MLKRLEFEKTIAMGMNFYEEYGQKDVRASYYTIKSYAPSYSPINYTGTVDFDMARFNITLYALNDIIKVLKSSRDPNFDIRALKTSLNNCKSFNALRKQAVPLTMHARRFELNTIDNNFKTIIKTNFKILLECLPRIIDKHANLSLNINETDEEISIEEQAEKIKSLIAQLNNSNNGISKISDKQIKKYNQIIDQSARIYNTPYKQFDEFISWLITSSKDTKNSKLIDNN